MKKPITSSALFSIVWRCYTGGVLLFAVPVLVIVSLLSIFEKSSTSLLQLAFALAALPFMIALQGMIFGLIV